MGLDLTGIKTVDLMKMVEMEVNLMEVLEEVMEAMTILLMDQLVAYLEDKDHLEVLCELEV
jgi:hypothetical protein